MDAMFGLTLCLGLRAESCAIQRAGLRNPLARAGAV